MSFIDILTFAYALSVGYVPNSGMLAIVQPKTPIKYDYNEQTFFTSVDLKLYAFDIVFIGGNVRTDVTKKNDRIAVFDPYISNYQFLTGITIGNETIKTTVQFTHQCTHPILTNVMRSNNVFVEGFYNEFSVKIEGVARKKNRGKFMLAGSLGR